jgi:hypothetical protein
MQTTSDRSLARHQRIYRTLLLAYPRAFRQVYGADMVQVFGDRLRDSRARSGRRASIRVWLLTLLDLFATAPLERMERKMSREAAFGMVFVLLLALAAASYMLGTEEHWVPVAFVLLAAAAIALGVSGSIRRRSGGDVTPAGPSGIRPWWVLLAGLMGIVEVGGAIGHVVRDRGIENPGALAGLLGAGLLMLVGVWFRGRSRSGGDWMIVIGVLPFLAFFWLIVPAILAVVVVTTALMDSAKAQSAVA